MTKEIFEKIGTILDNNLNICNYTITGYKFAETRLVLHFRDCNQVFDFIERGGELIIEKFYTKNVEWEEYHSQQQEFQQLHEKEQPEPK